MNQVLRWHGVSAASRSSVRPTLFGRRLAVLLASIITHAAAALAADRVDPVVSPVEIIAPSPRSAPQVGADRVLLISTRALGTQCTAAAMSERLRCERLVRGGGAAPARWQPIAWSDVAAEFAEPMPTVVYVHGNRVDDGEDRSHGLALYRQLAARKGEAQPIRYVIWSWPSEQIRGPRKDYQLKAARTRPVGWQLAWAIDQWPEESPLELVGYSYGARVVTGALHLLAGGELDDLRLVDRAHPARPPVRAALVAAAVDADWLQPGGFHGRALEQVDQLLLVNNQLDPAMRFYHLAIEGRNSRALGYAGVAGRAHLGELADRVRAIDVSDAVGRSHALGDYLAAPEPVGRVLEQLAPSPRGARLDAREASLAGRKKGRERQ